ncbi:hypothetical protein VNO77_27312 [Canavalia gladiata]|uniref:Uncharacterized protein n=1 Tax=Canavalia gladiata TaxID=3824 RepID=A0AAN9KUG5_CANGL
MDSKWMRDTDLYNSLISVPLMQCNFVGFQLLFSIFSGTGSEPNYRAGGSKLVKASTSLLPSGSDSLIRGFQRIEEPRTGLLEAHSETLRSKSKIYEAEPFFLSLVFAKASLNVWLKPDQLYLRLIQNPVSLLNVASVFGYSLILSRGTYMCVGNTTSKALLMALPSQVSLWPLGATEHGFALEQECGTVLGPTRIMKDSAFKRMLSLSHSTAQGALQICFRLELAFAPKEFDTVPGFEEVPASLSFHRSTYSYLAKQGQLVVA